MANIVLKTFAAGDDGQGTVTPQDDALIYQNAIPMNGIFSGATVTLSEANVLHVAAGFGIIGGRFFEINESDITVELSSSGTLLGRLYIHLELTNADVPISINVTTGATLPALVGDPDLNINDGAFDLELATFNVSEVTISDIVNTFSTISKANNQLRRATAYSVGAMAFCQSAADNLVFVCTTAGTTAVQQPTGYVTITDGNTITDGTAAFKAVDLMGAIDSASDKADAAQQMIAPILSSLVAPSGGLASGDQFIYNGLLYKATASVAQGGTIVINSNAELADCVTKQIKKLDSTSYYDWASYLSSAETDTSAEVVAMKANNVISVSIKTKIRVHSENDVIMTLPNGYRPQQAFYAVGRFGAHEICYLKINTEGGVVIYSANSTNSGRLVTQFTYIL
jgi:hypothetical protein